MKRKSCTVIPAHQRECVPTTRHLPLVDLLVDTRTELLELAVRSGMKVLEAMMEEDRTALCGARYAHEPDRAASRAGSVASEVVLGGRKVAVRRPRVRADGHGRSHSATPRGSIGPKSPPCRLHSSAIVARVARSPRSFIALHRRPESAIT